MLDVLCVFEPGNVKCALMLKESVSRFQQCPTRCTLSMRPLRVQLHVHVHLSFCSNVRNCTLLLHWKWSNVIPVLTYIITLSSCGNLIPSLVRDELASQTLNVTSDRQCYIHFVTA